MIEKDRIYTENSNKPHGYGLIDPNNFSPYPKNPVIARFFKEIGWVDELGSGVRKIHKYAKTYFGFDSKIIEENIFKIVFQTSGDSMRKIGPVDERINERFNERIMSGLNENEKMIINFLQNQTKIYNRDAVELTKLSPAHIRRLFISLQDKKLIVATGKGRDRGYTLLD